MATVSPERQLSVERLAQAHQAEVWRYLRYLGCDESLADDLVQETLLAVLRNPPEDRGTAAARAYLRTVARRQMLMALRSRKRRPDEINLDSTDLELAESVWAEHHPDANGGDGYLDALDDCLKSVNGRGRKAIDMQYTQGCSRSEIAEALDLTPDGVKSLLRRTRDALRQCVERKVR